MGHWNNSTHKCCYSACFGVRKDPFLQFSFTLTPRGPPDKLELVKDIIVALAKHLDSGAGMDSWVGLDPDRFLNGERGVMNSHVGKRKTRYGSLFAQRDFELGCVSSTLCSLEAQRLTVTNQKLE